MLVDNVDNSVDNFGIIQKNISVKLLTMEEVVLEYEYVINLLKLSEAVAGQMVEAIGRLAKSNKMSGWNIPKKYQLNY